jgi:hypothetical protein
MKFFSSSKKALSTIRARRGPHSSGTGVVLKVRLIEAISPIDIRIDRRSG